MDAYQVGAEVVKRLSSRPRRPQGSPSSLSVFYRCVLGSVQEHGDYQISVRSSADFIEMHQKARPRGVVHASDDPDYLQCTRSKSRCLKDTENCRLYSYSICFPRSTRTAPGTNLAFASHKAEGPDPKTEREIGNEYLPLRDTIPTVLVR